MKKLLLAFLLFASPAWALDDASIPPKFPIPWGNNAGTPYIRSIPTNSQIGITNGAASLTDGFPPLTFVPATSGGVPPFGSDFNGILKQITQWSRWAQAGGPIFYDSAFSTAINGYPAGAILMSAITPGTQWMSLVDNNTTNPDAFGAGWVQAPGQIPIGTPLQSTTSTIPFGYVSANGLTIGDASSNATNRANADTVFLFTFEWNTCSTSACAIFTSAGSISTRGASAAADYAAHKALAVPNLNGSGLIGADSQAGSSSANLSGVPITRGSTTAPGSLIGENLHVLTANENGPHTHTITDPGHTHTGTAPISNTLLGFQTAGATANGTAIFSGSTSLTINNAFTGINATNASGSGAAHNTVERSTIVYWNLKL